MKMSIIILNFEKKKLFFLNFKLYLVDYDKNKKQKS